MLTNKGDSHRETLLLPEDEDFHNWMRLASWKHFRKLYRVIERLEGTKNNRQFLMPGDELVFNIKNCNLFF